MRSVPGAVATGSQFTGPSSCQSHNPVATAPGTDFTTIRGAGNQAFFAAAQGYEGDHEDDYQFVNIDYLKCVDINGAEKEDCRGYDCARRNRRDHGRLAPGD